MKKILLQNVSIALLSKGIGFFSFLYIAKILAVNEYGNFIYINMILSLLPLLQFGSMHGAVVLLPKKIIKKDCGYYDFFWNFNLISHLLQILSIGVLCFLNIDVDSRVIFLIALNLLLSKYSENVSIYLGAKHEFGKLNIIKAVDQLLRPLMTIFLFYFYRNIESIFFSQFLVTFSVFVISNVFLRIKFVSLKKTYRKSLTKQLYKVGFFVYIIWAIDILFRTSDRWFVSQFYSLNELANYGFVSTLAMSIWMISMAYFAPYSQILYTKVAEGDFMGVSFLIYKTNKNLYKIIFVLSLSAFFAYPFVLDFFVHKYHGTIFLFFIMVMVSVFLSINNMYIYYMISNNFHFILIKYQICILFVNFVLNCLVSFNHLDIIYLGLSTFFSLVVYFLLVSRFYRIDIKKKINSMGF